MVEYDPGVSYRLEANPDYFLGPPLVDTLIMPVVRDAQAAFAGLQTGELDFVTRNLPAPLVPRMQENEEVAVATGNRMQSLYLMFNTRKPILRDPAVRKAMSMALDVQAIVDIVEGGLGRPGNDTWTHPDSPWAHPVGGHAFDIDGANSMLDAAGYPLGDGGVRRSADGAPLEFTLLVNAAAPPQIRSGELVAEQLSAIGVDITVEPLDPPAITAARRPGPDGPPKVEMFIAVFESHAHADPDHLFFFFHTPGRGVGGIFSGYANPDFDAVLEDALDAPINEKLTLIGQAQEIFAAEAPAVVLYYPDGRWGYRPGAYDGWISDPGHGVFTKRSFLAPYAAGSAAPEQADEATGADEASEAGEASEVDEAASSEDPEPGDAASDDAAGADDDSSAIGTADAVESGTGDAEASAEASDAESVQSQDDTDGAVDDAAGGEAGGSSAGALIAIAAGVVVALVIAPAVVRRRRRAGTVED